jgi:hypothetical protein
VSGSRLRRRSGRCGWLRSILPGPRLNIFVTTGIQTTIAAGLLWGIAAFLWVRVPPARPEATTGA